MNIKIKDEFKLPVKKTPGGVMPFLKDHNGEVIFVGNDKYVDATVIAINAYDDNQERIADLKLALADLNEHDDEITSIEITNQAFATLADARINKLIDENNELKAQANALRESLSKNQEWVRCGIGGNCSGYPKDHKDYIAITDLLNKTPAQCLQSVKADAVDEAADYILGVYDGDTCFDILNEIAKKLREGES